MQKTNQTTKCNCTNALALLIVNRYLYISPLCCVSKHLNSIKSSLDYINIGMIESANACSIVGKCNDCNILLVECFAWHIIGLRHWCICTWCSARCWCRHDAELVSLFVCFKYEESKTDLTNGEKVLHSWVLFRLNIVNWYILTSSLKWIVEHCNNVPINLCGFQVTDCALHWDSEKKWEEEERNPEFVNNGKEQRINEIKRT